MITTKRLALALVALTLAVAGLPLADVAGAAPDRPASRVPCPRGTGPGVDPATGNQCHGGNGGTGGSSDRLGGAGDDGGGGSDDGGDGGGDGGSGTPRPPTREEIEIAAQRRVLVKATTYLLQPHVSFDAGGAGGGRAPDVDVDAHVGIATFVEVTNWQGPQYDPYSEVDAFGQNWYINITSTPHLSFDPGEPGAPIVRCGDGGTRYDPDGPSIEEQASRPGACAYEYTMRTGVDGRPDAWPARVIVDWTITWDTNLQIPVNLPRSAQLVTPVPREIGEVSTVVVDD